MTKAVLDVNILVSAALNDRGVPARVADRGVDGRFELVISEHIIEKLTEVLERATLRVPEWPADAAPRGRVGEHGPERTELLATLQGLARQHPAATW